MGCLDGDEVRIDALGLGGEGSNLVGGLDGDEVRIDALGLGGEAVGQRRLVLLTRNPKLEVLLAELTPHKLTEQIEAVCGRTSHPFLANCAARLFNAKQK